MSLLIDDRGLMLTCDGEGMIHAEPFVGGASDYVAARAAAKAQGWKEVFRLDAPRDRVRAFLGPCCAGE